jgi:hypothetical protein
MSTLVCKACGYGENSPYVKYPSVPKYLNGSVGCSRCECKHCGHSMIWDSQNVVGEIVSMWHGTCRNCGKDSLNEICRKSVGKRVKYTGTDANAEHHGQGEPLSGEGLCLEYHNSHGLYILVKHNNGKKVAVDPITVEIL